MQSHSDADSLVLVHDDCHKTALVTSLDRLAASPLPLYSPVYAAHSPSVHPIRPRTMVDEEDEVHEVYENDEDSEVGEVNGVFDNRHGARDRSYKPPDSYHSYPEPLGVWSPPLPVTEPVDDATHNDDTDLVAAVERLSRIALDGQAEVRRLREAVYRLGQRQQDTHDAVRYLRAVQADSYPYRRTNRRTSIDSLGQDGRHGGHCYHVDAYSDHDTDTDGDSDGPATAHESTPGPAVVVHVTAEQPKAKRRSQGKKTNGRGSGCCGLAKGRRGGRRYRN